MRTILIIEDDQNLLEGLELLFQFHGYETLGVDNGHAGIDLICTERPDVVLTNFQMPGADGFDVLRAVRGDEEISATPVIFLTANHSPSIRERAVRTGADAFLTKPFDTDELLRTVAAFAAGVEHEQSA